MEAPRREALNRSGGCVYDHSQAAGETSASAEGLGITRRKRKGANQNPIAAREEKRSNKKKRE